MMSSDIQKLYNEINHLEKSEHNFNNVVKEFRTILRKTLCETFNVNDFNKIIRLVYHIRDITHGKGMYNLTYHMLFELFVFYKKEVNKYILNKRTYYQVIKRIVSNSENESSIGSWKDIKKYLTHLVENSNDRKYTTFYNIYNLKQIIKEHIREIIVPQLVNDRKNLSVGEDISFCAKWLPREKARSKVHTYIARLIAIEYSNYVFPILTNSVKDTREKYKRYRRVVSSLNKYLDTTQIHMCAREWDKINFDYVTKNTLFKNHEAFMNSQNNSSIDRQQCSVNYKNHLSKHETGIMYFPFRTLEFCEDFKYYIPCFLSSDPECYNIGMQMLENNILKIGFNHNEQAKMLTNTHNPSYIANLNNTKTINISQLYQSVLKEIVSKGLESDIKKFRIVVLTKYTMKESIRPVLKRYEKQSKGVYPSFFSSMKQYYKSYGLDKLPKIIVWDVNLYYKFPYADKKYRDNKRIHIIYGFNPIMTQYPLERKYIEKQECMNHILQQKRYNNNF